MQKNYIETEKSYDSDETNNLIRSFFFPIFHLTKNTTHIHLDQSGPELEEPVIFSLFIWGLIYPIQPKKHASTYLIFSSNLANLILDVP